MADSGIFNSGTAWDSIESDSARGNQVSGANNSQITMEPQDKETSTRDHPTNQPRTTSLHQDLLHTTSGEVKYFEILYRILSELDELRNSFPCFFRESGGATLLPQEVSNDVEDPTVMVRQMISLMYKVCQSIQHDPGGASAKRLQRDLLFENKLLVRRLEELHAKYERTNENLMNLEQEHDVLQKNVEIKQTELVILVDQRQELQTKVRNLEESTMQKHGESTAVSLEQTRPGTQTHLPVEALQSTPQTQPQTQMVSPSQATEPGSTKQEPRLVPEDVSRLPETLTTTAERTITLTIQEHQKLEIQLQRLQAENTRLKQELQEKSTNFSRLSRENEHQVVESQSHEQEKRHMNQLQASQAESAIQRDVEDQAKKLADLQRDFDDKTKKLEDLQQDLEDKTKKLEDLQQDFENSSKIIEDLKQEKETAINSPSEEVENLTRQIQDMKDKNDELVRTLEEKNLSIRRLEVDSACCEEKHEKERKKLTVEVQEKRDDLHSARDKIEAQKKTIRDMSDRTAHISHWISDHVQMSCVIPQSADEDDRITKIMSEFMQHVKSQMGDCAVSVISKPGPDIDLSVGLPVILPCIAASRVGSDISAALTKANIASGQVILVLFHHLAPHNSKINTPTEQRLSDRTLLDQCVGIVDAVFWNGAMYDCAANHAAVRKIQTLFRWSVSMASVKELKQLV